MGFLDVCTRVPQRSLAGLLLLALMLTRAPEAPSCSRQFLYCRKRARQRGRHELWSQNTERPGQAPGECTGISGGMATEPSALDLQQSDEPQQAKQQQVPPNPVEEFDLVVIGAGSAGTRTSRVAAQAYGAKVACVELPFGFTTADDKGGAGGT